MKTRTRTLVPVMLVALTMVVALAGAVWAAAPGPDGYIHTGHGTRIKKVAFISVKVYAIDHYLKYLPAVKSKANVAALDVDKRIKFKMLRDVGTEKMVDAFTEGYKMNGFTNVGLVKKAMGAFSSEDMTKGSWVTIDYNATTKATKFTVQGGGTSSVNGFAFMVATWNLWFGVIDQPALGTAMISDI